jgi:hypothetical protein
MASLVEANGALVPEAKKFDKGDLLALMPGSLLPVWWPEEWEGEHWTPTQRVAYFEQALEAARQGLEEARGSRAWARLHLPESALLSRVLGSCDPRSLHGP